MRISDWSSDVCSSDLNDVWQRLGFSPRNERPGRGKGDRVLTLWWRSFGQPDLFSLAGDADDRPVAALYTQLLIWGADGHPLVTENLLAAAVRADVVFGLVDHSLVALNGQADPAARQHPINLALNSGALRLPPTHDDTIIR